MICKKCKKGLERVLAPGIAKLRTGTSGGWGAKDYYYVEQSDRYFYACKNEKCTHFQILKTHFPSNEI